MLFVKLEVEIMKLSAYVLAFVAVVAAFGVYNVSASVSDTTCRSFGRDSYMVIVNEQGERHKPWKGGNYRCQNTQIPSSGEFCL